MHDTEAECRDERDCERVLPARKETNEHSDDDDRCDDEGPTAHCLLSIPRWIMKDDWTSSDRVAESSPAFAVPRLAAWQGATEAAPCILRHAYAHQSNSSGLV